MVDVHQQEDDSWMRLELSLSVGKLQLVVDRALPGQTSRVEDNVPGFDRDEGTCVADVS